MERYEIISDDLAYLYHKGLAAAGCLGFDGHPEGDKEINPEEFYAKVLPGLQRLKKYNRTMYDSFFGSIFCIGLHRDFPDKKILLAKPENESYDLIMLISDQGNKLKFKSGNTEWYKNNIVAKLELTELRDLSFPAIKYLCDNKLTDAHDYIGRILLIIISVEKESILDLSRLSSILRDRNNNFKNIWAIANTGRGSLYSQKYLITELLREPLKLNEFEIQVDFDKVLSNIKEFAK